MSSSADTPLGKRKLDTTSFEETGEMETEGQAQAQPEVGKDASIEDTEMEEADDGKSQVYSEVARIAANLPQPKPIDIQYTTRRMSITVEIKMPKNAIERIKFLTEQLNDFLKLARMNSSQHVRVIKFSETRRQTSSDRKSWLKHFKGQGSNHLSEYLYGFFPWQPLRDGAYRFRIFLAIPLRVEQTIHNFIKTMNNEWGDPQKATVMDLLGQEIYSPKKMGFLLRSNRFMANTRDLQEELMAHASNEYPDLKFSLTFQSIPDPTGAKWHPDTAVKGIIVETNEDTYWEAWSALHKIYNKSNKRPPLGIHMSFVGMKDHPEFQGNPNVINNISVLMKRQTVFQNDSAQMSTSKLRDIDEQIAGTKTLRMLLMELRPTCSGPELKKGRLFHSISRNINRSGVQEFYFTYNKAVAQEAGSVVSGICEFIRDELKINPEICCHAHQIRDDHKWDPITRTASNPDTEALQDLLEGTKDLSRRHEQVDKESFIREEETMDEESKVLRERQRSMGITDDGETVESMTKPKKYSQKRVPHEVGSDDQSITSGISGITEYTSTSKASQERKSLRKHLKQAEATSQKLMKALQEKEAQRDKERAEIRELLKTLSTASISPRTLEAVQGIIGGQESGESSADNSHSQEGQSERGKDDKADIGLRFKLSKNQSYPPQAVPQNKYGKTSEESDEDKEVDSIPLISEKELRQRKVKKLAKQGRIDFNPLPEQNSEDSLDRWGEDEESYDSPPRAPRKVTKLNEQHPVDLTNASTFEDEESSSGEESDGWKVTQSDEEDGNRHQSTHLDSSDSESEQSNSPKSRSVTDQMINNAKSTMTKNNNKDTDATGGDTPGMDV